VCEAAHFAEPGGRLRKVQMRERVCFPAACGHADEIEEMLTYQVRRPAPGIGQPDVHIRLAIVDRHELRMRVGEMQQTNVAERTRRIRV
jgi:hypothetical protein